MAYGCAINTDGYLTKTSCPSFQVCWWRPPVCSCSTPHPHPCCPQTAMSAWAQLAVSPPPSLTLRQLSSELEGVSGLLRSLTPSPLVSSFSGLHTIPLGGDRGGGPNTTGSAPSEVQSGGARYTQAGAGSQQNGSGGSYAGSTRRDGDGSAGAGAEGAAASRGFRADPVRQSYEELMQLRVAELKSLLAERGMSSADCFEKSDLVRKLLEKCSV